MTIHELRRAVNLYLRHLNKTKKFHFMVELYGKQSDITTDQMEAFLVWSEQNILENPEKYNLDNSSASPLTL